MQRIFRVANAVKTYYRGMNEYYQTQWTYTASEARKYATEVEAELDAYALQKLGYRVVREEVGMARQCAELEAWQDRVSGNVG